MESLFQGCVESSLLNCLVCSLDVPHIDAEWAENLRIRCPGCSCDRSGVGSRSVRYRRVNRKLRPAISCIGCRTRVSVNQRSTAVVDLSRNRCGGNINPCAIVVYALDVYAVLCALLDVKRIRCPQAVRPDFKTAPCVPERQRLPG